MKKKEAALNLLVEVFSHKEWGLCKIVQMNQREAIVQEFGKTKIIRHPIPYGQINDKWVPEIIGVKAMEQVYSNNLPPDELLRETTKAIESLMGIVNESEGVIGWHLNGDVLKWEQFEAVQTAEIQPDEGLDAEIAIALGWGVKYKDVIHPQTRILYKILQQAHTAEIKRLTAWKDQKQTCIDNLKELADGRLQLHDALKKRIKELLEACHYWEDLGRQWETKRQELKHKLKFTDYDRRIALHETWYWMGDGEDHLESLECPVIINAGDLRDLITETRADERKKIGDYVDTEILNQPMLDRTRLSKLQKLIAKLQKGDSPEK